MRGTCTQRAWHDRTSGRPRRVSPASVFLGLARRQPAIAPTGLFPVAPSRGALVAISVDTILVSVAVVPAPVVVPIMLVSVLVFVLVPMISHQRWRAQA